MIRLSPCCIILPVTGDGACIKYLSARHLDGSPRLIKLNRFLETQMDHRVKEVIESLRSNLEREVHADKMALLLGLSVSRLYHLFKNETGTTPGRYQQRLRIERACSLLESRRLSVKEIVAQVGASDLSHFIRDFKKARGVSPKRYRLNFLYLQDLKKNVGGPDSHQTSA
jgi:AraC-like DNA-binding protein